jgi:hypothetical protein
VHCGCRGVFGLQAEVAVLRSSLQGGNSPQPLAPSMTLGRLRGPEHRTRPQASHRSCLRWPGAGFIFPCRNNNQPTAIYPLGTFPRGLKKAHVMMLPSCPLWYYDDLFPPLVDVVVRLTLHRSTTLSAHLYKSPTLMSYSFLTTIISSDTVRRYQNKNDTWELHELSGVA